MPKRLQRKAQSHSAKKMKEQRATQKQTLYESAQTGFEVPFLDTQGVGGGDGGTNPGVASRPAPEELDIPPTLAFRPVPEVGGIGSDPGVNDAKPPAKKRFVKRTACMSVPPKNWQRWDVKEKFIEIDSSSSESGELEGETIVDSTIAGLGHRIKPTACTTVGGNAPKPMIAKDGGSNDGSDSDW